MEDYQRCSVVTHDLDTHGALRQSLAADLHTLGLFVCHSSLTVSAMPFEDPADNNMALINEVAVSIYLYLMMILTDPMASVGTSSRETLGWILTLLICTIVFINQGIK